MTVDRLTRAVLRAYPAAWRRPARPPRPSGNNLGIEATLSVG